jgi:acetyltransferase-like isoleucine patch superfamily enzyme
MKEVGRNTYGHDGIKIIGGYDEGTKLIIGKFCSIAEGVVVFLGANHRVDWFSTYPFGHIHDTTFPKVQKDHGHPATKGDVTIGNDVWIATNAVIMSGVRIGDGAVIGAYSIVTKDVPPYTIVAGNPAKQIRKRFSDDVIHKLLELKWWDKSDSEINEISDILCSNDIEKLNNI